MKHYRLIILCLFCGCIAAANAAVQSESKDSLTGELDEVVVNAARKDNLLKLEIGHIRLSGEKISRLPSMLGEPDLVRALQNQPGVSPGVEGFTGLYVHGGNNDQNLFLYQGLPLHQVSHLGGLFSSFNVATVKHVDFFKSSFPARYGGRVSSISDISAKPAWTDSLKGEVSAGLISGSLYVTGPISRGRTGFSIGLRRTWLELVSVPVLALMNYSHTDGKSTQAGYSFSDLNLRLDHHFSTNAECSLIGYYSSDRLLFGKKQRQRDKVTDESQKYFDDNSNNVDWGNMGALASFRARTGDKTSLYGRVYWTRYSSKYKQRHEYQTCLTDSTTYGYAISQTTNSINTFGTELEFRHDLTDKMRLSAGAVWNYKRILPEGLINRTLNKGEYTESGRNNTTVGFHTTALWADWEFSPLARLAMDLGVRAQLVTHDNSTLVYAEPRAAVRFSLSDNLSLKAAVASMTQTEQQISNNFISLPTDLWQPSFPVLRSLNTSFSVNGNLPHNAFFSAEIWWREMRNLLEYREGVSLLNASLNWRDKLTKGTGRAYGVDLSFTKHAEKWTATAGYGLLWNRRKFPELNGGEAFPAKFDNRHKINLQLSYKPSSKMEFFASWIFMSGNRLTLSMYNYATSGSFFPGAPSVDLGDYIGGSEQLTGVGYISGRNNVRMPAYHRLDLGMSIYKHLDRGRSVIWNIGLYNAYCHMNTLTIQKDAYNDAALGTNWKRSFKSFSLLPLIPSFSFTYRF